MSSIFTTVLTSLITMGAGVALAFIFSKFVFKSKAEVAIEQIHAAIEGIKEWQPMVSKCLLALMVAAKDGRVNGELTDALHSYNEYMHKNV